LAAALVALLQPVVPAGGYPLDGSGRTGIRRLDGYLKAQQTAGAQKLPPGALLGVDDIHLSLLDNRDWDLVAAPRDPELQPALEAVFRSRHPSYGVAVIDITDPASPAWAGVREERTQLPGSVGKIACLIALFDGLRRAYPEVGERQRLLREHFVVADSWATGDPHTVPKYDSAAGVNRFSVVVPGDRFTLSEWVDHMISASANSAGAMVWREAMLLRVFGSDYPPSPEQAAAFFRETPGPELTQLSQTVINEPLAAAGIELTQLQQGTFWTRVSQARIPGIRSFASPRELARVLLRIEQGRMVDEWSSLEMKRYLYMTKKRYRYAYPPELAASAIYFKSGSFYQCRPEEGFQCAKYRGNVQNLMNSIAIVESPAERGPEQKRYIVALISDVLKVNSAWDHSRLAAAIEEMIQTRKPVQVRDKGSDEQLRDAGRGD
jgi:hypothetical protein